MAKLIAVQLLLFLGLCGALAEQASPFDHVVPSDDLNWQPCYDDLFCAMLRAPLDYQTPCLGKAIIPLVKVPSQVKPGHDNYKGMVIFSPGGFGLSGINTTVQLRETIRSQVGPNSDIVSFDPRGFGLSVPSMACGAPPPSKSRRSIPRMAERFYTDHIEASKQVGDDCKATMGGPTDAGPHISAATVARDVMRIVDAYARTSDGQSAPGQGRLLNFLGWSYASYIGQTIAGMFPDRIGGMVLDGVLNPISLQANLTSNTFNDVDGIVAAFFVYCYEAGPEKCVYHAGSGPMDIWKRFAKSIQNLGGSSTENEDALQTLKLAIINFAYTPLTSFPPLAQVLQSLEKSISSGTLPAWTEEVRSLIGPSAFSDAVSMPAFPVSCPEQGNRWYGKSLEDFQVLIEENKKESILGEVYTNIAVVGCSGWSIDALEIYEGPFGGETQNPILFISNTYDIPCPKRNSFSAATRFKNSKAFIIDGIGHVSMAVNNSCAMAAMREYFEKGKMPDADGCPLETGPFGIVLNGTVSDNIASAGLSDLVGLLSE